MTHFAAKVLASGQLPDAQAALYTVPATTATYVKQIYLFNTSANPQTIELFLDVGTARAWRRIVLEENQSCDVLEHGEAFTIEAGHEIQAVTSDAAAVDYVITGIEEDLS
jgi:hypothetical protein